MPRQTEQIKQDIRMEAARLRVNPCPSRTEAERNYIARRLIEIVDVLNYHLLRTLPIEPRWLPEMVITPRQEELGTESVAGFQKAKRDSSGYVLGQHDGNVRAANRVRVGVWYQNADHDNFLTSLIIVSPLPCDVWGALPLTRGHWRIVINALTRAHQHWKWVHSVRDWHDDPSYVVGGEYGWHLESNEKLKQDHSLLWTGQAIYSHIVRKYSDHVSKG